VYTIEPTTETHYLYQRKLFTYIDGVQLDYPDVSQMETSSVSEYAAVVL